jgi:hypothetical protein
MHPGGAQRAVAQAIGDIGRERVTAMPSPSNIRASADTWAPGLAESSMTMDAAQIRPSTVNGSRRAVKPVSSCVVMS